jgi:hypothetical protein
MNGVGIFKKNEACRYGLAPALKQIGLKVGGSSWVRLTRCIQEWCIYEIIVSVVDV